MAQDSEARARADERPPARDDVRPDTPLRLSAAALACRLLDARVGFAARNSVAEQELARGLTPSRQA